MRVILRISRVQVRKPTDEKNVFLFVCYIKNKNKKNKNDNHVRRQTYA